MDTPHPVRRWLGRAVLTYLAAASLTVAGISGASAASVPSAQDAAATAAGGASPASRPLCDTPTSPHTMRCMALKRTDVAPMTRSAAAAAAPAGYGPADIQSAYKFPADGGAGQTVAIVDAFDNPNAEADLATYRAQFGLPACTTDNGCFRKVDQRGGTDYPVPNAGWAGEIALDVDMISAACPACHILLVEADTATYDDLGAAVNTAVAQGAEYVSNSYGAPDTNGETDYDKYYDHPGVAITASTGDDGYGVSYPASSPHVTAVGGTALRRDSSTRGWTESAWSRAGSGCSGFEAKPAFQHDTGCDKRTTGDVSAVADPATGLAVYNTFGGDGGWTVFGGTSASAPIIAAGYAQAGRASAGEYPNTFPYLNLDNDALNDVTSGANGSCTPAYLCTAVAGYDGPTGLGTPNGVSALQQPGAHGTIAGTVTDASTHKPIEGAAVKVGSHTTKTDATGAYTFPLNVGTYDLTVDAYGYGIEKVAGVTVTDGGTVTRNVALTPVPMAKVSGRVTDGSGHGWPLYAKLTVDGVPTGPWHTDPVTGRYSLTLPSGHDYTVHATGVSDGYRKLDSTVSVSDQGATADLKVPADSTRCVAPGYHVNGLYEEFGSEKKPAGWTVVNHTEDGGWEFDDPGTKGNRMKTAGASGGFASVNSEFAGFNSRLDTELVTPAVDLSTVDKPVINLASEYFSPSAFSDSTASIDLSLDGGSTWDTLWSHTNPTVGPAPLSIDIPQAAHQADVKVRFHYWTAGNRDMWWQLDNVLIGAAGSCDPVPGGLVVGQTLDANTQQPIAGSTVVSPDAPDAPARSKVTDDPAVGDGFFTLFVPKDGRSDLTASHTGGYSADTEHVQVRKDAVAETTFRLAAGRLNLHTSGVLATGSMTGKAVGRTVEVRNTGTAPLSLRLSERSNGATLADAPAAIAAPKQARSATKVTAGPMTATDLAGSATPSAPVADGNGWAPTAQYPTGITSSVVAVHDGKLYSVDGYDGASVATSAGYVYDPKTMVWSPLPKGNQPRQLPTGGFIDGKLYITGGWNGSAHGLTSTEVFDPAAGTWTAAAPMPIQRTAAGTAVLHNKLYLVGGMPDSRSEQSTDVQVYDPKTDRWTKAAPYPVPVSLESCGAIGDKLYCAGGESDNALYDNAYVYDPVHDAWSKIASLPTATWGAAYSSANGKLIVTGGVTDDLVFGTITNTSWAYDPATDSWQQLPSLKNGVYKASAAAGYYVIGGLNASIFPRRDGELLAGYDADSSGNVPWLAGDAPRLTLKPGQMTEITVTLDPGGTEQPGTYQGAIEVGTDSPYAVDDIPTTLTATPPPSWGKLSGAVDGVACDSNRAPLFGAYLEIDSDTAGYARRTDADGHYSLWIDSGVGTLNAIASKDGWRPAHRTVDISAGHTVTADFGLKPSASCS
ncbi:carboxypeptidase regulatory-like domain-containing protein [Streptomyces sp. NPDC056653]|uniref:carboxypeptidase regulatory-like domain-containing protein n=1 Tax=Streptomyces sp. NPDC056653 TaxID=3345894 RepID=UPI0036ACEE4A